MQARFIAALCLALAFCSSAYAQLTLENWQTFYTSASVGTTVTTAIQRLDKFRPKTLSARAYAENLTGSTPTLDVTVQSCELGADANGITATDTCTDRFVFDQCTTGSCYGGDKVQTIDLIDGNADKFFRVKVTIGGTSTPAYKLTVKLGSGDW